VPYSQAVQLLAAARKKQEIEAAMVAEINEGTQDNSWIDAALKRANCTIEE
jgi:regulator of RNase E activity RraA